jgi:Na+-translocating ferredoxin:NAD+ oxidoreductase RnfG subunit
VLDLEAHKRNAERNNSNAVIDWIYDTITSVIEPTTAEQQNELIQNVMNYMELNASLKSKERDLEKKEKTLEEKDTIVQMMPGLNFSKR